MQAKRVQFGSLMFLSQTPKQLVKKRRLRDILLMTVRASLIALLALAFARPFLPPNLVPFVTTAENESVVLLLDTSFSMGMAASGEAGETAFDQAMAEALNRIDSSSPSDEIAVVSFSDVPRQLSELGTDKEIHRTALATLRAPDNRSTRFYDALRLADEILQGARHEQRRVVLLSDMQQSGWPASMENWKLAAGVAFEPVQLAPVVARNTFVEDLAITMRRATTSATTSTARTSARSNPANSMTVRVDARVVESNTDDDATPTGNRATLQIGSLSPESHEVPATSSSRVSFQKRVDDTGLFSGSLKLNDDALAVDNQYYFSFAVAERPSVLSIDGGSRSNYRESFFLQKAFDLGAESRYDFSTGNESLLTRRALAGKSIVFAGNLSSFSTAAIGAIREYVEEGGLVVLSFGDRSNLAVHRTALRELGVGSTGQVTSPIAAQGSEAIIGDVTWRHPVFSDLQGAAGGILRPKFRRYVSVAPDSAATVIASFDTGEPWIIEKRIGRGSLLVTTATLGSEWTNFPINELYVPFVYQLAGYAVNIGKDRMMYRVGETVMLTGRAGEEWTVRNPHGDEFLVTVQTAAITSATPDIAGASTASARGIFRQTDFPGQYVATNGSRRVVFSVNLDPMESDVRFRDPDQVYASVVPPSTDNVAANVSAATLLLEEEKNQKLWRLLLGLVLLLFLVETFLANKPKLARRTTNKHA